MCFQQACSDQSAVSSSTQHDNDLASGGTSPFSARGDDGTLEDMEVACAQESAEVPYSTATFHYSRHQVRLWTSWGRSSVFTIASIR